MASGFYCMHKSIDLRDDVLCKTACELRAARTAGDFEIQKLQVPQLFTVCGLPYSPVFKAMSRRAILADSFVELEMKPRSDSCLPYGADRLLLYWLAHNAQITKDRYLPFNWLSKYLSTLGFSASGTNRRDVESRLIRIASADIRIINWLKSEFKPANCGEVFSVFDGACQLSRHQKELQFSQSFLEKLASHTVPIPLHLLRLTRGKSQFQDCCLFLERRSYAAQSISLVRWDALNRQFPLGTCTRDMRFKWKRFIEIVVAFWPEIRVKALPEGLQIGPPDAYLCQDGADRRILPLSAASRKSAA
jgi:hypothetical protein